MKKFTGIALVIWLVQLTGCGSFATGPPTMGGTPGGAQDIGYFRSVIENGRIPYSEYLTFEGLFSEHDIPITGPPPNQMLCLRTAIGVAPVMDTNEHSAFIQIGMLSDIDPNTFERSALNLSVVIDKSGSMSMGGEKMHSVKIALKKLVDNLNINDILSLVVFDSTASTKLSPTPVTNKDQIKGIIDEIYAGGSTNINEGLQLGYGWVFENLEQPDMEDRVMLFTDALPNTGDTSTGSFINIVQTGADQGIGLTAFGVGLDFGIDLINTIANLRGGNYFYLEDETKIRTVFYEDFDFMVTPLVYDLVLRIMPGGNFAIADVYGIPDWTPGEQTIEINVPTIFLSRKKGAILIRLSLTQEINPGSLMAQLTLSYTPHNNPVTVNDFASATYDGLETLTEGMVYHSQIGVRKAVALINFGLTMKKACDDYENREDVNIIIADLNTLEDYLEKEAVAINDSGLSPEAELVGKLIANIQNIQ